MGIDGITQIIDKAHNGFEALKLVKQANENTNIEEKFCYGLIFMDCSMPIMDGISATKEIRKSELASGRRETPIIALTANTLPKDRALCKEAGMNGFLAKPIRKAELLLAIDDVEHRQRQRAG